MAMLYEASSHILVSKFNWMNMVSRMFPLLAFEIAYASLANIIFINCTHAGLAVDEDEDSTPIA